MQPQRLVIGVGNPLRGDDGVGPWIVQQLANEPDIATMTVLQLTPELCATIADYSHVLVIDAAHFPADHSCEPILIQEAGIRPSSTWSHDFEPSQLVQLTRSLFGTAPPIWTIRVPVASFQHGAELSDLGQTMAQHALRLAKVWIAESALHADR
jgi:hydrogenase maturation protease